VLAKEESISKASKLSRDLKSDTPSSNEAADTMILINEIIRKRRQLQNLFI